MPQTMVEAPAASARSAADRVMPPVRDLLACVGLVNLLFLRVWLELQAVYTGSMDYFRAAAPTGTLLGATLLVVLGCAAGFCAVLVLARRSRSRRLPQLGRCLFLLAFAISGPGAAIAISFPYSGWALGAGFLLDRVWLAAAVVGAALVWVGGSDGFFRAARHLAIIVSPLLPLVMADTSLAHWTASRTSHAGRFESSPANAPAGHAGTRVLVLVFDELDSSAAFSRRPAGIRMPAFDRLRQEALWAGEASPPARCTFHSLPMLLTGRNELTPAGNESIVRTGRQKLPTHWGSGPNLFAKARGAGAGTAVVGWYHPYCSALAGSVDYCWSLPSKDVSGTHRLQEYCAEAGLAGCAAHVLRRHAGSLFARVAAGLRDPEPMRREHEVLRKWDLQGYLEARSRLLGLAADPSYRFIVGHLPIPHPLGIYDRHTDEFTLNEASNYFDNLELADSMLGEVRAAMERAGVWNSTALIITSDHGLRPRIWNYRPTWTAEEAAASENGESLQVPLIVKLAGPAGGPSRYTEPVNVLIAHDLSLELLRGGINGYEDLRRWMGRNRERTWVQELTPCF